MMLSCIVRVNGSTMQLVPYRYGVKLDPKHIEGLMLDQRRTRWPALTQHWVNVSYLLETDRDYCGIQCQQNATPC